MPGVRNPITFSDTPARYDLPPPGLDEHGEEIRRMADRELSFPTSIGTSDADHIRLLGQDLAADLMGKVGFGELAFWLVAGRRPTPGELRVFEAVLVALADHGFTPTAIAARLTYLSAPESLQGALAAGLLGGGSRFLGVTEDCGRFLADALAGAPEQPSDRRRAGTRWRSTAVRDGPRPSAGSSPASGTRCTRRRTRGRPVLIAHRRRGGTARPAPAAVRGDRPGPSRRCSAGRCRSTAPASAAPRWPTSGCRSSCCAASRCWPARPACSVTWPRSGAARSAWTST